jgi:hypothetical protein
MLNTTSGISLQQKALHAGIGKKSITILVIFAYTIF